MLNISDLGLSARGRHALKFRRMNLIWGTQRGTGHLLRESSGLEACFESPQLTVQSCEALHT